MESAGGEIPERKGWPLPQLICLLCSMSLIFGALVLALPNGPSMADFIGVHGFHGQVGMGNEPLSWRLEDELRSEETKNGLLSVLLYMWLCLPVGIGVCIVLERRLGSLPLDAGVRELLLLLGAIHLCACVLFWVLTHVPPRPTVHAAASPALWQLFSLLDFLTHGAGVVFGIGGMMLFRSLSGRNWCLRAYATGVSLLHLGALLLSWP